MKSPYSFIQYCALLTLLLVCCLPLLAAQNDWQQAMQFGDESFQRGDFNLAKTNYLHAIMLLDENNTTGKQLALAHQKLAFSYSWVGLNMLSNEAALPIGRPSNEQISLFINPLHDTLSIFPTNRLISYRAQAELYQAEKHYLIAISSYSADTINSQFANCLNNLAATYLLQGKIAPAAKMLASAKPLFAQLFPADAQQNIALYINQAALQMAFPLSDNELKAHEEKVLHVSKAQQFLNSAMEIQQKVGGEESHEFALLLMRQAAVAISSGNGIDSLREIQRAYLILRKQRPLDDPDLLALADQFAWTLRDAGKFNAEEIFWQENLREATEIFGRNNQRLIPFLSRLGLFYRCYKSDELAEAPLMSAYCIAQENFGTESPQAAATLEKLSWHSSNNTAGSTQVERYQRLLALLTSYYGNPSLPLADALFNLAFCYRFSDRMGKMRDYLSQAEATYVKLNGSECAEVAAVLDALQETSADAQEFDALQQRILNCKQAIYGEMHPNLIPVLQRLAHFRKIQGRNTEAENLLAQAEKIARYINPQPPVLTENK